MLIKYEAGYLYYADDLYDWIAGNGGPFDCEYAVAGVASRVR